MVEECSDTRIHGLLGWKAMPFARDDLDSNLVNMDGEEAMMAVLEQPQLRGREERLQWAEALAADREAGGTRGGR